MFEYLKGIVFVFIYILFNFLFGAAISKKNNSVPKNFIIGYIVFAALLAIVGIPVQLLALRWEIFAIYLLLIIMCILIFIVYRLKKYKILKGIKFLDVLNDNWFLIFLGIILVAISTVYFEWYWLNNGLDDGYYINRMATLPYIENPFRTSPATGLSTGFSLLDSYIYNIYELEASVYIYLLNITPTLYARCFLAFINYFLFECVIYVFFEKILLMTKTSIKKANIQYFLVIIIIFSFSSEYFSEYNIYKLQDIWQNASAMYFGSSIVRSMGLMLLILPLLGKKKIIFKDIIVYMITSFALLSKSSIVMPFSILVAISALIVFLLKEKKRLKFEIFFLIVLFIIGIYIGNNTEISQAYRNLFILNINSIFIIVSIILGIVTLIYFRNTDVIEIGLYLGIITILSILSPINNIFEKVSMYSFVACRFMTGIFILLIIFSYFGFILILVDKFKVIFKKNILNSSAIFLSLILGFSSVFLYNKGSIVELKNSLNIFINNKYFVPESVIILGNELEKLSDELGKKLYVVMPEGIGVENKAYSLAISIRQFTPSTVSLSALGRYPGTIEKNFDNYSVSNQEIFANFTINPNEESTNEFKEILDEYPINCFVTLNDVDQYSKKLGFKKYKQINFQNNYYIYYRDI